MCSRATVGDRATTGEGELREALRARRLPLWRPSQGQVGHNRLSQVHGLRGQISLAERIELDNYDIAHWSLGLDLKIIVLTVAALFRNAE